MSNLPIRRVVLYKHGVGYFEREAAVSGDEALTLRETVATARATPQSAARM